MTESKTFTDRSEVKTYNWQSILIASLMAFYLTNFGFRAATEKFPYYGQDYLAFWSAGKVADQEGYTKIYDLQALRSVEGQVLRDLGVIRQADDPSFMTLPALYLPVFLVPFQLLSQIPIQTSLVIWWVFNFLLLTGYLIFFTKTRTATRQNDKDWIFLVLLALFSYPVFDNFLEGQINVLLLVFVGEFIRNAEKERPFVSGLWLAGILLKPQLLILVVPLIMILRYWKMVYGFFVSSLFLLTTSLALSGTEGITGFINLLMRAGTGAATSSPQYMINWRMVGTLLNGWTASNYGWIAVGLGMLVTLAFVIYLVKDRPSLGGDAWVIAMTGIFSATLEITWHVHNHTAMVMLPLLMAVFVSGLLRKRILWFWNVIPVIMWVGSGTLGVVMKLMHLDVDVDLMGIAIPLGAFLANICLFLAVVRWKHTEGNTFHILDK